MKTLVALLLGLGAWWLGGIAATMLPLDLPELLVRAGLVLAALAAMERFWG
jgi:hypothetical protein